MDFSCSLSILYHIITHCLFLHPFCFSYSSCPTCPIPSPICGSRTVQNLFLNLQFHEFLYQSCGSWCISTPPAGCQICIEQYFLFVGVQQCALVLILLPVMPCVLWPAARGRPPKVILSASLPARTEGSMARGPGAAQGTAGRWWTCIVIALFHAMLPAALGCWSGVVAGIATCPSSAAVAVSLPACFAF